LQYPGAYLKILRLISQRVDGRNELIRNICACANVMAPWPPHLEKIFFMCRTRTEHTSPIRKREIRRTMPRSGADSRSGSAPGCRAGPTAKPCVLDPTMSRGSAGGQITGFLWRGSGTQDALRTQSTHSQRTVNIQSTYSQHTVNIQST